MRINIIGLLVSSATLTVYALYGLNLGVIWASTVWPVIVWSPRRVYRLPLLTMGTIQSITM
mgnify:CR=1 FL=1